ncbi:MAG: AI-2E family transporter [Candidatus Jorgensenbacteria bacterium]|nr:AI-2E family transporter [Candidatus Jorgensenbacteria bacterium]
MASFKFSRYSFFGIFLCVLILSFFVAKPYLGGLLVALTFAIIVQPFYKRVVLVFRGRRGLAALLTIFLVIILIIAPFIVLGTKAFQETLSAYSRVSSNMSDTLIPQFKALDRYFPVSSFVADLADNINQYIRSGILLVTRNFGSVFSSLTRMSLNLIISLFALYFFLKDGDKLISFLFRMSPLSRGHTEQIVHKLNLAINSVVMGMLFIALVQGIFAGIGYFLFGVPQPIFWGAVTALTSLIPAFGTMIIIIPVVIYLFVFSGTFPAVGMLLWGALIVGTIDNVLRSVFMRRYTDIHPFLIFLSVLGGLSLFGSLGILLGPLVLSLLIALLDLYPVFVHGNTA